MPTSDDDPSVIRSIAVTAGDVVAALEHNRTRRDRRAVLRITPPFNGRMRARLHVESGEEPGGSIHLDPERLVAADRPSYPRAEETEDRVREELEGEYSTDRHYEIHVEAVREWREALKGAIVDEVDIDAPGGPHRIEVKRLG